MQMHPGGRSSAALCAKESLAGVSDCVVGVYVSPQAFLVTLKLQKICGRPRGHSRFYYTMPPACDGTSIISRW